jgi:hypothetical protein
MDPSAYLLPVDELSLRVGKIVLAAARLEFEARMFALELPAKLDTKYPSLKDLRNAIVSASNGHPESQQIKDWIAESYLLWGERHRLAHGLWLDVYDVNDPTLHALISQRGFDEVRTDLDHLDELLAQILRTTMAGIEIANAIRERRIAAAAAWGGPFGMP